ncbi:MAG TPA: phage tail protein [Polyangiaceae bacterium]
MAIAPNRVSSLLELLPAVFQEDRRSVDSGTTGMFPPNFLGRFLLPFEELLLGLGTDQDITARGLEEVIANIARYFEPRSQTTPASGPDSGSTPDEFLPWLAGWVALTLRDDWTPVQKRELIARTAQLYQLRGTKRGIEEVLTIYTGLASTIDEFFDDGFRVGVNSTVGVDTYVGGGAPFFFHVKVAWGSTENIPAVTANAKAIIELQKPAHTYYSLTIETPIFQIGIHSTVGKDTLLG